MKNSKSILPFIILICVFLISSCAGEEGFTPGIIAIFITGAFAVGVLFYFLFRKQDKRKGDNNRKP
ncbi:MAG: hypothetical protein M3421_09995 [Bacteroidota bacterium]|jgi:O-antigen/teichoic acid export membrane protein|nr:hypothetical protein [Bacteroidota bacterium]